MKRKRCCICNKRVKPLFVDAHTCKCGMIVCSVHKSATAHACTFDWREREAKILERKLTHELGIKKKGNKIVKL